MRIIASAVVLASALMATGQASAQGVIVKTYPRQLEGLASQISTQRLIERLAAAPGDSLRQAQIDSIIVDMGSRRPSAPGFFRWTVLRSSTEAARFWGTSQVTVLPAASLVPSENSGTIFTELAAVLSAGWRFALSTTLSVGESDDGESVNADDGAQPASTGETFRRFLVGGGNVSFSAYRPIGTAAGGAGAHTLFLIPRAWTNVPTLSTADNVSNFGGETALEYQYLRFKQEWDGTQMGAASANPFLTLQIRIGVVSGSRAFYDAIGRPSGTFMYTTPAVNLTFTDDVRVGAAYFYGFGALRKHESLRFHMTLNPTRPQP